MKYYDQDDKNNQYYAKTTTYNPTKIACYIRFCTTCIRKLGQNIPKKIKK